MLLHAPTVEGMKHFFAALNDLLDTITPIDQVENLKTFAAIDSITRTIEQSVDIAAHSVEKLRKFRWEALYAIVPGESTKHLPQSHYIAEARFALRQAAEEMEKDN